MGKRSRFPLKLPLLPGLRWQGTMTVEGPIGITEEGAPTFLAHFDAEVLDPRVIERFVFDRAVLSAKQIHDWTGVDLDPAHVKDGEG